MALIIKNVAFEIKDVGESGTFSGYGSVYGVLDQGDDIIVHGAFSKSLEDWSAKGRMPALLWQHNQKEPIGVYTKMMEDNMGLYVEGQLALKTQRGAEAYELMQMKALSGLSVGFMARDDSYDQKTGIRTIKQGDLWEVSPVTFPMNDMARISQVKSIDDLNDLKSVEKLLRDAGGFSRTEATALISRIKRLSLSESDDAKGMKALLDAVNRRNDLLKH